MSEGNEIPDRVPRANTPTLIPGLRLGRIRGVEIVVHWSLLVIFALIAISLGGSVFADWHPEWSPALRWLIAVIAALLFFVSIAVHELAHAVVGRSMGVPVDGITLFIFGGMAHMSRQPPSARSEFWMTIVGPATSLLIGVVATGVGSVLVMSSGFEPMRPGETLSAVGPVATLLLWLGPINILLAVFNLIPGFPLDGGRMLRAALWWATGDLSRATRWASTAGRGIGWGLIGLGFLMAVGFWVPVLGTGLVNGLWLMLIGWFLSNAARVGYEQVLVREALTDVPVRAVMRSRIDRVDPQTTIEALVLEHFMASDQRAFPVMRGHELLGLVCMEDVRRVPREKWRHLTAADIMTAAESLEAMPPNAPAFDALTRLGEREINQIPIVENHELLGLVRREDILKWLSLTAVGGRLQGA